MPRKRDHLVKTKHIGVRQHVQGGRPTGWYEINAKRNHPRKPGKKWEIRRTIQAADAEDAARQRAVLIARFMSGNQIEEPPSVRAFCESWLKSKLPDIRKSTRMTYAIQLAEISAELGDFRLDLLSKSDVVQWRDGYLRRRKPNGERYAPTTWNNARRVGRSMYFDAMAEYAMVSSNPFALVRPVAAEVDVDRDVDDPTKTMSADQLAALLEAMRTRFAFWYPLACVMATGACRFSEPTALRWSDVRFEAGEIVVSKRQVRGDFGTLKTSRKGLRKIKRLPLLPEVAAVLKAHRRRQLKRQSAGLEAGLVFPGRKGKPVSLSGFNYALKEAAKAAGLSIRPTSHWFRHTLNAQMKRDGVPAAVAKSITGHSSDAMIEHYGDIDLHAKAAAVEKFVRKVVPLHGSPDDQTGGGQ